MKCIRNNPLRFALITLTLFAVIGICTAATATANTPLNATQITDFDGNGRSEVTLFDTTFSRWFTYDFYIGTVNQLDIGLPGDRQVAGDYDGDGITDFATCYDDPTTGIKTWKISYSTYGPKGNVQWGSPDDIPVPADYDGDGTTDFAVFRPSEAVWYIHLSGSDSTRMEYFGYATDKLVPADYDGDGMVDIAVMRPELNEWYILYSSDHSFHVIAWDVTSMPGDVLVPADYDGDGRADIGVYRHHGGLWIILETTSGFYRIAQFGHGVYTGAPEQAEVFGTNVDLVMPGDFDGDGIIDIAVWNTESTIANVLPSTSSILTSMPVGTATAIPVSPSIVSP